MMMTGVNVNASGELGTIELYSEPFDIPPATALIGGTAYAARVGPLPPVGGIVVAGIICATLALAPASSGEHLWPTIEITVAPLVHIAHGQVAAMDLKATYNQLRRQMVSEGVPFLNAAELEREIADRKGSRSGSTTAKGRSLRDSVIEFREPLEPVAGEDWDALH